MYDVNRYFIERNISVAKFQQEIARCFVFRQ